jgi:hypothetical protein
VVFLALVQWIRRRKYSVHSVVRSKVNKDEVSSSVCYTSGWTQSWPKVYLAEPSTGRGIGSIDAAELQVKYLTTDYRGNKALRH